MGYYVMPMKESKSAEALRVTTDIAVIRTGLTAVFDPVHTVEGAQPYAPTSNLYYIGLKKAKN